MGLPHLLLLATSNMCLNNITALPAKCMWDPINICFVEVSYTLVDHMSTATTLPYPAVAANTIIPGIRYTEMIINTLLLLQPN